MVLSDDSPHTVTLNRVPTEALAVVKFSVAGSIQKLGAGGWPLATGKIVIIQSSNIATNAAPNNLLTLIFIPTFSYGKKVNGSGHLTTRILNVKARKHTKTLW